MRAVIQRVSQSSIKINGEEGGTIKKGFVVLVGVSDEDSEKEADYLADKVIGLRVFNDSDDKMNLALEDVGGEIMIVSNFTLYGNCKKGNRPSFIKAEKPPRATEIYNRFVDRIKGRFKNKIVTGEFGADMQINLINDGPITIIMDTDEMMPQNKKTGV